MIYKTWQADELLDGRRMPVYTLNSPFSMCCAATTAKTEDVYVRCDVIMRVSLFWNCVQFPFARKFSGRMRVSRKGMEWQCHLKISTINTTADGSMVIH